MDEQEQLAGETAGRGAGGCVAAVLVAAAFAVVFAVSAEAGVLAVWAAGGAAVWWSVRRRVSDSSATPPPERGTPSGDVFAGETGEIARVERDRAEVICILHPVREEVTEQ
jgi:hypothetical protein